MLASVLACSGGPPPPAKIIHHDAGPETGGSKGYTLTPLGCGAAGTQAVAAVSGSTVAFASLSETKKTVSCTISPLGPPMTSKVPIWDICYAVADAGGSFKTQVVSSSPFNNAAGVGLGFDSKGNPTIAFTGQGTPKSEIYCGANNLFVTSSQGSAFSTPMQVSNGSPTSGLIAAQAGNCAQGVCTKGDTTGLWPAVGFDPSDNAFIPFRDIHFGFAVDDYSKSDVELAEGSGGSYQILTVDVSRGGGDYNRIAFDSAGLPAILQYNSNTTGASPGVYLNRQAKAASFGGQTAKGVWVAQQIFTGQLGQEGQLGFGISPKGLYAAAYWDAGMMLLMYTESMDATTWSAPVPVDTVGYTGLYPSLAFDAQGDPAIAYYRCNTVTGGMSSSCDESTDGLVLARRNGTTWSTTSVTTIAGVFDGLYPALAFVNGKAKIAYQQVSNDPLTKVRSVTWWVAEEP